MKKIQFQLTGASIALCDLLKVTGLTDSGGAAKHAIAAGEVTVNGEVETRKRRKIVGGETIGFGGQEVSANSASLGKGGETQA